MAETGCPCGTPHELAPLLARAYGELTAGLPDDVTVKTPGGSFKVPRIFIAVHGLKVDELPALAARYGWERVGG